MISLFFKWLILSVTVIASAYIIPGISVSGWLTALIAGLVLGLINLIVKPVLTILTLPINVLTLGLFALVLNALLFWATSYLVHGFVVQHFLAALLGSILVSVVLWFAHLLLD